MANITKRELNKEKMVCKHCFFIYTPEYGDEESNVVPYTNFADIDEAWKCPICEGPKEDFIEYSSIQK